MNTKTTLLAAALFAAGLATGIAQDTKDAGAPSPEMIKNTSPGPMHEKLKPLAGKWTATAKWRMSPDAPWEDFSMTVDREWVMGGRYLEETVETEWMGAPFEGRGILGHDNVTGEYTFVWFDNMSTAMQSKTGKTNDDGAIVFEGFGTESMTGETEKWSRTVLDFSDPAKHLFEFSNKDADGNVFVSMEMVETPL